MGGECVCGCVYCPSPIFVLNSRCMYSWPQTKKPSLLFLLPMFELWLVLSGSILGSLSLDGFLEGLFSIWVGSGTWCFSVQHGSLAMERSREQTELIDEWRKQQPPFKRSGCSVYSAVCALHTNQMLRSGAGQVASWGVLFLLHLRRCLRRAVCSLEV